MHVQPLFATWAAEWELLAPLVWLFLTLSIVAALLVSRFSPLSLVARRRLLPWLPALMLLGCLLTRWIRIRSVSFLGREYFYKFYYAHLDTTLIICFAFGVAFTLDSLRAAERRCRIVGWIFVPLYIGLLAATLWYIHGWYEWWSDEG